MRNFHSIKSALLAGAFVLPLNQADQWTHLKFNRIAQNQVQFSDAGLKVDVDSSAGPLVFKLPNTLLVQKISAEGQITGSFKKSFENFEEDSYLRVGLVAEGTKTLNRAQRFLAADWVKKLFELVPKGKGLDKIYFFNLGENKNFIGKTRVHPKSELMLETVVATTSDTKAFRFTHTLEKPLPTAAIWLSIDGDDSQSKFTLQLKELRLND